MLITAASLHTLFLGLNTSLNKAMASDEEGAALHQTLCIETTSTGKVEQYPHLGDLGIVQEKEQGAPSKIGNIIPSDHSIANVDFERLLEIHKNDLEDDKLNIYTNRITDIGEGTRRALDYTLAKRMVAGFTTLKDYTGTAYFADSKPINAGSTVTFDNKDTKKISEANFEAALENLANRTDAENVNLNLGGGKLILVVGPKYRATAKKILETEKIASGADNINFKAAELKVWGHLAQLAPHAWFLFAVGQARKPFIKQVRQKFATSMTTDPNDSYVLTHNKFIYKISGRMNIGAGESLCAFGSTGEDAA